MTSVGMRSVKVAVDDFGAEGIGIEGTASEFEKLAQVIESTRGKATMSCIGDWGVGSHDGVRRLSKLVVEDGDAGCRLHIERGDDAVVLRGSKEARELLRKWIVGLARTPQGEPRLVPRHQHVEWYEGHEFLDADSVPVILVLRV
jgi:hypothetical protein